MNPLHRIDEWMRAHPVRTDVAQTALLMLLFGSVPWVMLGESPRSGPLSTAAFALVSTGLILPWAFRRVRPVASAAVTAGFAVAHILTGPELSGAVIMVPLTVYNLAARAPRWASRAGLVATLLGGTANGLKAWLAPAPVRDADGTVILQSPPTVEAFVFLSVFSGMTALTAWALGDVVRNRRLAVQALEDRARRLEVQSRQERELAAADERNHIAREMHDIVAHSLQVIISQSDGARYAARTRPEVAVETLETIGRTGRAALADMRQLLGVLRGPADPACPDGDPRARPHRQGPRPQPALTDLPALAETMGLSGLHVTLDEEGAPRRPLPPGGELTAYRVVQEALTNTLRHAGPEAHAVVTLRWTPRGLEVTADDDGRGAGADPATRGAGQGLRGLAERVALFGGTSEAGPRPGGGFRVHASLPYTET